MLKGLYSGRKIKATPGKLTRTQTGKQAMSAIVKKYGEIVDSAKYKHVGKGNWVRYSIENDRKRTGKVTTDLRKWTEQPHKLDYRGKDTKRSGKSKGKIKYSVSDIKRAKPIGRKVKKPITQKSKPVLKTIPKISNSTTPNTIADKKNKLKALKDRRKELIENYGSKGQRGIYNSVMGGLNPASIELSNVREKIKKLESELRKEKKGNQIISTTKTGDTYKIETKEFTAHIIKNKGIWDNKITYSIITDRGGIQKEEYKTLGEAKKAILKIPSTKQTSNKRFAISSLKSPAKPKRRTARTQKM